MIGVALMSNDDEDDDPVDKCVCGRDLFFPGNIHCLILCDTRWKQVVPLTISGVGTAWQRKQPRVLGLHDSLP